MAIVQNGCVSIRAAVRRITLFGRNSPIAFDDENRNKSLFRLTIMNVYTHTRTQNWDENKIQIIAASIKQNQLKHFQQSFYHTHFNGFAK